MENNNNLESQLLVTNEVKSILKETSKWSKFLGIIGFIFTGLIVLIVIGFLIVLLTGTNVTELPSYMLWIYVIVYALCLPLYFFPSYYLYKFSEKISSALSSTNQIDFLSAIGFQKSFFKFYGIATIVVIALYLLLFIGTLIFGFSVLANDF